MYAIAKSQADIGIYTDLPHDADIQHALFREDSLGLLVPKNHPLAVANIQAVFLKDCLDYEQIILRTGTQINYQLTKVAMEANRSIPIRAEVDNYETMCLLINAGTGSYVGVLPYQSSLTFNLPNTQFIALKDSWAQRKLLMGVRNKNELSGSAALLFEFLQQ